jgi:peptide methionine sulfoxide reductase MsrB
MNATIMVAADDYFATYVDGVLAHAVDTSREWRRIEACSVTCSDHFGNPG